MTLALHCMFSTLYEGTPQEAPSLQQMRPAMLGPGPGAGMNLGVEMVGS